MLLGNGERNHFGALWTDEGWLYLAIVLDLFNREVVGWSLHPRMSRKGNCWDNALTESWFNSFKNERVHGLRYATRAEMTAVSSEYIEVFYNRTRRHSTLGYKSPMQFLKIGPAQHA